MNLLLGRWRCTCNLNEESDSDERDIGCKQCYLQQFIKTRNLNIRIPSPEVIYEIERNYNWDHRFTCSSTYK
jgi:DNA-directed RNA polymerase subunit RPC12/RpoP